MADKKRDYGPIKGSFPNPETIQCRDCIYRDKTVVKLGDDIVSVGVTKDSCEVYNGGKAWHKPHDVLFNLVDCEFKETDSEQG